MKLKRGFFINLFLIILIVILVIELFLPGMVEKKIKNILIQQSQEYEQIDVDATSFPAVKFLFGQIDFVQIKTTGLIVDNLRLETFNINYNDVKIGKKSFSGENTDLYAIVTEKDLNKYIKKQYPDQADFSIKLNPEQVYLEGAYKLFENDIALKLSGSFNVSEAKVITFEPDNFQIEDINIPVNLLKSYLDKLGFKINLKELKIPLDIEQINIKTEQIEITGGNSSDERQVGENE